MKLVVWSELKRTFTKYTSHGRNPSRSITFRLREKISDACIQCMCQSWKIKYKPWVRD